MKQYLLRATGATLLAAMVLNGAWAQDKNEDRDKLKESDVLVIKHKPGKDAKLNIEINDGSVKVNGKPLSEFNDDDVTITRRKDLRNRDLAIFDRDEGPQSRFRGGTWNFNDNDLPHIEAFGGGKALLGVATEKAGDVAGARVTGITEGSAAAKAGLKKGDIITAVNGNAIKDPEALSEAIGKMQPEDKVTIKFLRDKKEQEVTATLGKRSFAFSFEPGALPFRNFNFEEHPFGDHYGFSLSSRGRLGIKAQDTEEGTGVKVLEVADESPAAKAGLKEGDLITELDGKKVDNIDALRDASREALGKTSFKIKFNRDGKQQVAEVKIPKNLKTASL